MLVVWNATGREALLQKADAVFPEAVKTHSAQTWMYRAAEDQNFPNEKVQSTCTDGQEQRSLGFVPTPSPRNVSVPKADFHKYSASDRPASPQYSDYQTACTLGEGELSRAEMARELDYLRQTNKKLQEALMSRESEVDTLKLDAELLEPTIQARIADNTAALVEEVYHAQRMREEAMMDQLRLANEERDEARLRLQQLELALKEGMDSSPEEGHMALQEILCGLQKASSRDAVQHNRTLVVEYFRKRRERAEQITAKEMGAIIQERDLARAQSKHLEKELHLLRESKQTCPDIVTAQRTFEPLSKAQMTFLQNDQDKVIENYKKLEEELQTLRLCYSLHQSLTQEAELKEQYSKAITIYEEALRNREDLLHITQQQNQDLCRQLQEAQTQSTEIQDTLQRTSADLHEAKDKTHKLERLVDVLRKKVGTGSVRSII